MLMKKWKSVLTLYLLVCFGVLNTCVVNAEEVASKEELIKQYLENDVKSIKNAYRSNLNYNITKSELAKLKFARNGHKGNYEFFFCRGLEDQGVFIVDKIKADLDYLREEFGLCTDLKVRFYIIRMGFLPQTWSLDLGVAESVIEYPVFVKCGEEDSMQILSNNIQFAMSFFNSVVKESLEHNVKCPILPDFDENNINGTLWFRKGLAEYLSYEMLKRNSFYYPDKSIVLVDSPSIPLSYLKHYGKDVLSWNSFNSDDKEVRGAGHGVLLMLENRYGKNVIRKIMKAIDDSDYNYIDGNILISIINKVIGGDLCELINKFNMPSLGIEESVYITPTVQKNFNLENCYGIGIARLDSEGILFKEGLMENDIIISINDMKIETIIDIQVALLENPDVAEFDIYRGKEKMHYRVDLKK